MKKLLSFFTILVLSAVCFAEPQDAGVCEVRLIIKNVQTTNGTIVVSIHDSEKSFSKRIPLQTLRLEPELPSVLYTVKLPCREYAFCVYHDTNGDGELNTNLVGIPKEPFGFSNYEGKSAPGNFKRHKVVISTDCDIEIPLVVF